TPFGNLSLLKRARKVSADQSHHLPKGTELYASWLPPFLLLIEFEQMYLFPLYLTILFYFFRRPDTGQYYPMNIFQTSTNKRNNRSFILLVNVCWNTRKKIIFVKNIPT